MAISEGPISSGPLSDNAGDQTTAIVCEVGIATAGGLVSVVSLGRNVQSSIGGASAFGLTSPVYRGFSVSPAVGLAAAFGLSSPVTITLSGPVTSLSQADIDAIVAAVWAHPNGQRLLTVAQFLSLK